MIACNKADVGFDGFDSLSVETLSVSLLSKMISEFKIKYGVAPRTWLDRNMDIDTDKNSWIRGRAIF